MSQRKDIYVTFLSMCTLVSLLQNHLHSFASHQWNSILKLSNDRHVASELLVNHESENTHHRCSSVVELDGALLQLRLIGVLVPSEVKETIPEVSREFSRSGAIGRVLHDEKLQVTNENSNLANALDWDGVIAKDSSMTVGERVEAVSRRVD